MPRLPLKPYWQTSDHNTVKLYQGDVLKVLSRMPTGSVQMVMTSPPYWGLRDYGTDKTVEIGSESTPGEYVAKMVEVFNEVRRVLRNDGTVWLNMGDSYSSGTIGRNDKIDGGGLYRPGVTVDGWKPSMVRARKQLKTIASGNLVGMPWRLALALQADGWILRQDIIWCLSGGTWIYVRSQKGDMPMMVQDVARLDPSTVKLWNGEKWTGLRGTSWSKRTGDEIEILLRSGERISCTPAHRFPLDSGKLTAAENLQTGDCLLSTILPEPATPIDCRHLGLDAAWLAGLYLAEGCGVERDNKMQIAGHRKELARWNRVVKIVKSYGGHATLSMIGNNQTIRVYGKVVCAVVRELITGNNAKTKHFSSVVWKYSNSFLRELMAGYLHGDASNDGSRYRLDFCRNNSLERDIRTACARLGWTLTLNQCWASYNGDRFPSYRGEIRKSRSGHWNEKNRNEIVQIRKARCRKLYSLGVEDEPNIFALASGVLTHNSKPSPMPESVRNRCTKAHEYLFLLVKRKGYYYDAEAIKDNALKEWVASELSLAKPRPKQFMMTSEQRGTQRTQFADNTYHSNIPQNTCNKRSVWTIASEGYPGAHFATFPRKLVEPCILAGTSAKGCCVECGAPWRRVMGSRQLKRDRPNEYVKRTGEPGTGNSCANTVAGVDVKTVGWEPTCECFGKFVKRKVAKNSHNDGQVPTGWAVGEGSHDVVDHSKRPRRSQEEQQKRRRAASAKIEQQTQLITEYVSDLSLDSHLTKPCIVLDPFVGSGTVCCVALVNGRWSWGIDLSKKYLENNAVPRIQGELLDRPGIADLAGVAVERVEIGKVL